MQEMREILRRACPLATHDGLKQEPWRCDDQRLDTFIACQLLCQEIVECLPFRGRHPFFFMMAGIKPDHAQLPCFDSMLGFDHLEGC